LGRQKNSDILSKPVRARAEQAREKKLIWGRAGGSRHRLKKKKSNANHLRGRKEEVNEIADLNDHLNVWYCFRTGHGGEICFLID